jgi:hypothetical protein
MPEINVRHTLVEALRPLLPKSWRLIPYATNLDVVGTTPVVMLRLNDIEKLAQSPLSHRVATFSLLIIEPKTEPGRADDAIDDKLIDLLSALDTLGDGLTWSTATSILWADTNPAYRIELRLPFVKE